MVLLKFSAALVLLSGLCDFVLSTSVFLPLYIYPTPSSSACSAWTSIISSIQAYPSVTFYIVVNPNSGPGPNAQPDSNYQACVPKLKSSNVILVGYVRTGYGTRAVADVNAEIATYAGWSSAYRLNGIFLDETQATSAYTAQYRSYASKITSYGFFNVVVTNPGIPPADPSFYSFSNLIVTSEEYYNKFSISGILKIDSSNPANQQVVILHDGPSTPNITLIKQLSSAGIKSIFMTDKTEAQDPYASLPTQWSLFVQDVAATV